ncbi:MAG: bifunctional oligoribonuclease/PAP phosphatase NrnA [Chthoniobacteraceae bacterium]|nr:bifunctional oligoribonuclease/PAP phosphatase NrnA [Chthoniobacteraceae bacterium]
MTTNCTLAQIAEALRSHRRFVVISHIRPDGDAVGCAVALALCLRELGKEAVVWNDDGPLEKLRFLPGSDLIQKPPAQPEDFDVAIAVDTSTQPRLGDSRTAVGNVKLWINLDHHISNTGFGDLVYIDSTAPASGQIVFELIQAAGFPLTPPIAENLWAAIATDTGSFQYSNTTARTFEIAAELIRVGVQVGKISERLFQTHPRRRLELLRAVLNAVRFTCEGRAASCALPLATVTAIGATPEDTEGLIDTLRGTEGVVIAAFLEELEGGKVRISTRSKDPRYDVCKICAQFGGGGHTQAAGARVTGGLAEVEARVLQAISDAIQQP